MYCKIHVFDNTPRFKKIKSEVQGSKTHYEVKTVHFNEQAENTGNIRKTDMTIHALI